MTQVTEADRKIAADMFDELSGLIEHVGIGQVGDLIRAGEFDGHMGCDYFSRHREQAVQEAVAERDARIADAVVLIDELNKRKSSRDFYGINQTLHAKLATVRAQLARAALQENDNVG